MDAHLDQPLFWGSLALALGIAGIAAYPVNRWLIGRGRGHARVHERMPSRLRPRDRPTIIE